MAISLYRYYQQRAKDLSLRYGIPCIKLNSKTIDLVNYVRNTENNRMGELFRKSRSNPLRSITPDMLLPKIHNNLTTYLMRMAKEEQEMNDYKIERHKEQENYISEKLKGKKFYDLFYAVFDGSRIFTVAQANYIIDFITADGNYLFQLGEFVFTISPTKNADLISLLSDGYIAYMGSSYESDGIYGCLECLMLIRTYSTFAITKTGPSKVVKEEDLNYEVKESLPEPGQYVTQEQGFLFFPKLNNTDINLERYQIFKKAQESQNCLIHTLSLFTDLISPAKLNTVKLAICQDEKIADKTRVSKKLLEKIANIIKLNIVFHTYHVGRDGKRNKNQRNTTYGENFENKIDIAGYMGHYFIYEPTIYSVFSITNYDRIKDLDEFYDIFKEGRKSKTDRKLNSLQLVEKLGMMGKFIDGNMVLAPETSITNKIKDNIFLDDIVNEQREIKNKKYQTNRSKIWYADNEAYTKGYHKLFMIACVSDESDEVKYFCDNDFEHETQNQVNAFMFYITDGGKQDCIVYFHNLKYDNALLEEYLNLTNICKKDNQLYNTVSYFKGKRVEFRDSLKMINMPLNAFAKNFNLPADYAKSGAINYEYYHPDNYNQLCKREHYAKGLPNDEKEEFYKAVTTEIFNPTKYYKSYLRLDCLCLKKGMQKFNELINSIDSRLSIYDSLTISSLTDKYMNINGAYDGVWEISGNLRNYISQGCFGGRVHANEKFTKHVINEKISDFDGVSLYPSAIKRLCDEKGLPMGPAKRLTDKSEWQTYNYCMLTVKIKEVRKFQQMPFIAVKNIDCIDYTNTPPADFITIIDSVTLQDYIEFHDIVYEIIEGVYWDEGGNQKMGELVQKLFDKRTEAKKTDEALGNVLKLMLNSSYGKTIQKTSNSKINIVKFNKKVLSIDANGFKKWTVKSGLNYQDYVHKNFHRISTIRNINDEMYEISEVCLDTSFNRAHCGTSILSYSKRIMNELFNVANDNNLTIYYTDTDSLHLKYDDVDKLKEEFSKKYNRVIEGKALGQFHTDFSLKGTVGDVWATTSVFLGKKSYCDILEGKDKDGNIISGSHVRLKAITVESITHHSKEYKNGVLGLFTELATNKDGKKMTLNPFDESNNKKKAMFHFINGGVQIRKVDSFSRHIKF